MADWIRRLDTRSVLAGFLVSLAMTAAIFHEYLLFHRTLITDSDVGMQYVYRAAAAKASQSFGEFPLWNPLAFTGISWIGQDPWANALHTFQPLFFLVGSPIDAYMLGLMLIFFLAGCGSFYFFWQVVSLSMTASTVATGVYLFNYDLHEHIAMLFSAGAFVGLPFMMILAERYSRTLDMQYPLWAAVLATLCYLSSNILCLEILILFFPIFTGILTFQQRGRLPRLVLWACFLFVVVTALLSSLVLWPAIDNRLVTIRTHLGGTRPHWWFLAETVWTQIFGLFDMLSFHHDQWHYQHSPLFHEFVFGQWLEYLKPFFQLPGAYGYISILLIPVTVWAFQHRRNRWVAFFGLNVIVLAAVGIVEGLPLIGRVFYFATGGHSLLRPGNALLFLGSAGLIGLFFDGLQAWLPRCPEGLRRLFTVGSTVLTGLCTLIFAAYVALVLSVQAPVRQSPGGDPEQYKATVLAEIQQASTWLPIPTSAVEKASRIPAGKYALLLSFYSLGSLVIMSARWLSRIGLILWFRRLVSGAGPSWGGARWILAALILTDCFINQQAMGGFTDRAYYVFNPRSVESRFLDGLSLADRTATVFVRIQDKDTFEILSAEQRNRPIGRQFYSFGSFYPLLLNYQMLDLVPSYSTYISMVPLAIAGYHRAINRMAPDFDMFLHRGERLDSAFYLLNPAHELANELAIEYFFVPAGYALKQEGVLLVTEGDDYAIYRNLRAKPRIELQSALPGVTEQNVIGNIIRSEFRFNSVSVEVEVWHPGRLILRDTYDPHWVCEVDGIPVPVSQYRDLFRQVEIGPGQHQIQFQYVNPAFTYGASVSGITLLGTLTGIGFLRRRGISARRLSRVVVSDEPIEKKESYANH